MKFILLLLTLAGILYMLSWWLSDFQETNTVNDGNSIVAPIEEAENVKALMEVRYQE